MSGHKKIDTPYKYEITVPGASALVEALRAFGYSLETAIADLIDNSVTAKASSVWVEFNWDGRKSSITIRDDGAGMTEKELVEAMRPGTRSPLEERDPHDLGRFGLGLKTSSFSQCRRLTVSSRVRNSSEAMRCWDLDYIRNTGEWRLIAESTIKNSPEFRTAKLQQNGTIIIWQKLDRVVGDSEADDDKAYRRFLESIDHVRAHLGMVFHRYLEKQNGLKIWINERPVESWDAFLKNEIATQRLPPEKLSCLNDKTVTVVPYILPHRSKLSLEAHRQAAGPGGWNAQQGIYVYRNERLLVAGGWLGLGFQKEEHYKLARIQIDLPNTLDAYWQIDVKKSRARPPGVLRPDLRRIAKLTRDRAVNIYRHRGKVAARKNSHGQVFLWEQKKRRGKIFYSINRSHPAIQKLLKVADDVANDALKMIEETVPSAHIMITASEQPDEMATPFEDCSYAEFEKMISSLYYSFISSGCSPDECLERISSIEPFNYHPEYIGSFRDKIREE